MEPKDSPTLKKNKDKTMAKTFKKILKPGEKKKKQKAIAITAVKTLCQYLETNCTELEGICRISGNSTKVKELKKQLENGDENIDFSKMDQHVVSGALKSFYRESEEPLLTFDLYKNFLASIDIKEKNSKIAFIKSLLSALPKENYELLQILLKFCYTINLHSDKNKMTSSNLAIVFSPTLLRPKEESLETMMLDSNSISEIVRFLIEEFHVLYELKQTILYQVSAKSIGIEKDKRSTSEQLEDAKVSIEQLTKHLAEEARERSILETYSASLEQKIIELQDINKSMAEEKDSLGELLNEFRENNKKQAAEIEQLKEIQNKTENEKNELLNIKLKIEKDLESLKLDFNKLNTDFNKLNTDFIKLTNEFKSSQNEIEKLKQTNKEKELDNERLKQLNKEKDLDNQKLREQTVQLQKEKSDAASEVERVQAEISLLLSSNNDKSSKKNSLKNQKKDLDNALKKCKEQESKINQLEKEKSKLNDDIIKLQKQSTSSPSSSSSSSASSSSSSASASNHKFVFGKKPSQKSQPVAASPTPPPPIDEDDLISVKRFAFYYMSLYIKTDSMIKGLPCNISSSDVLEELIDKKIRIAKWSEFINTKLKEINK